MSFCHAYSVPQQRAVRALRGLHTCTTTAVADRFRATIARANGRSDVPVTDRYAVIGAGLAGIATAWHLVQHAGQTQPVEVTVFDAVGIAAGGSGSAAGLLHPFTPRGKLLWKGEEAMNAAMELINVAAQHMQTPQVQAPPEGATPQPHGHEEGAPGAGTSIASVSINDSGGSMPENCCDSASNSSSTSGNPSSGSSARSHAQPASFRWMNGMVKPAGAAKMSKDFFKTWGNRQQHSQKKAEAAAGGAGTASTNSTPITQSSAAAVSASCISPHELQDLVPGIQLPGWITLQQEQQQQQQQQEGTESIGAFDKRLPAIDASSNSSSMPCGASTGSSSSSSIQHAKPGSNRSIKRQAPAGPSEQDLARSCAALYIPDGLVLDVQQYLEALWQATQAASADRGNGSIARMVLGTAIHSLEGLEAAHGPFKAVIVAAGAAAGTIAEVAQANVPLHLCQGYTLVMKPSCNEAVPGQQETSKSVPVSQQRQQQQQQQQQQQPFSDVNDTSESTNVLSDQQKCQAFSNVHSYPQGAPSILGQPYLAAHGSHRILVGASRSFGWSPEQALLMCQPENSRMLQLVGNRRRACEAGAAGGQQGVAAAAAPGAGRDKGVPLELLDDAAAAPGSQNEAAEQLLDAATAIWAPLREWEVNEVRSGMRALPPRTPAGSIPLVGRITEGRPWWLVVGLGARGLVYHSWVARLVAQAAIQNDEAGVLPQELLGWKLGSPTMEFEQP